MTISVEVRSAVLNPASDILSVKLQTESLIVWLLFTALSDSYILTYA